jgi:hypothetical protein
LKGILLANHNFQVIVRPILSQIGLFTYVEEIHASRQRKPSVLEAVSPNIYGFPQRNICVFNSAEKDYLQQTEPIHLENYDFHEVFLTNSNSVLIEK